MVYFHHPNICWKDNTAGHQQARRSLKCISANFLTQVIKEPMKGDVLLDLISTDKEELVGDMKAGDSLSCSDCELVQFRIQTQ